MGTSKLQTARPIGDGMRPGFVIKVRRLRKSPAPWTWAIHREGHAVPHQTSSLAYPSADEAWEVAHLMLDRIGRLRGKAAMERRRGVAGNGPP